jgi:glycosyltransferase involved in cell wall biosynthesis
VIPVFEAVRHVERTIDASTTFGEHSGLSFEIVLVNDGSRDGSWEVLRARARRDPRVVAIDLLHNYGQHAAVLCGLAHARGRRVATLDDDLQNPPDQIALLLAAADRGADVVFGRPRVKRHGLVRRVGSRLVDRLNTVLFAKPPDLVLTNFRLLDRAVVDRILGHHIGWPYVNGLAVLYARRPVNVTVEHSARVDGRSSYGVRRTLALLGRILFGYSAAPLRLVSLTGIAAALASFGLGSFFLVKALWVGTSVPGWASVMVLLSFLNGITLLLLGMLGEYAVRLVRHAGGVDRFHVAEVVAGASDGGT